MDSHFSFLEDICNDFQNLEKYRSFLQNHLSLFTRSAVNLLSKLAHQHKTHSIQNFRMSEFHSLRSKHVHYNVSSISSQKQTRINSHVVFWKELSRENFFLPSSSLYVMSIPQLAFIGSHWTLMEEGPVTSAFGTAGRSNRFNWFKVFWISSFSSGTKNDRDLEQDIVSWTLCLLEKSWAMWTFFTTHCAQRQWKI